MRHDKKKSDKPGAMPSWLRYVLVLFLAYMMLVAYRGDKIEGEEGKAQPKIEKYDAITQLVNIDRWRKIANPNAGFELDVIDAVEGTGDKAACGQEVVFGVEKLITEEANDIAIPEMPMGFRIGEGPVPWDRAVRGMRKDGVRKVRLGPKWFDESADIDGPTPQFQLVLNSLAPQSGDGVGFSYTRLTKGRDVPISCGETAAFAVAVWKSDNTELFKADIDQPLIHTLGSGALGHGLDRGLVGMQIGEIRKLIIPSAYQTKQSDIVFPDDEIAIVEVLRVPYNEQQETPEPTSIKDETP